VPACAGVIIPQGFRIGIWINPPTGPPDRDGCAARSAME
jgi:hypothetical protein